MPKYFTGRSVSGSEAKTLTQSDAGTFRELVQREINMPVALSVTRDEYHALPPAAQSKAKQVGYLVACTFATPTWEKGRKLEHAQECNLVFLDIDAKDGVCPAAPFVAQPELLAERLGDFNFAAYRTISSTETAPRLRVMVDARAIPVDRYAEAAMTIAQLIGLPHITPESTIAVQPMFRPTVFADQDVEEDHPFLTSNLTGRPFTVADISLDLESMSGPSTGSRPAVVRSTGDPVEDYFQFLQLPVPGVTLTTAREAMDIIGADCTRKEWINVAAGLKHQFQDQLDAAFEVFDDWSSTGGDKYAGPDTTKADWRCLSAQPRGRAPVTIRTMLKMAAEKGWDGNGVKEVCYQAVSTWMMFTCKSGNHLIDEGVRQIAGCPLLSSLEEEQLMATLIATMRQRFEMPAPSLARIKKEVRKLRESLNHKKDDGAAVVVPPPWANGVAFVASTKEFCRQATRQIYDIVSLNAMYSVRLLPTLEDLQNQDVPATQTALHTPMYLPANYLLNHLNCQKVDDYDYDPSQPEKSVTERDSKLYLNIYRRSYRAPNESLASYAEDVLLEHVETLIKEQEYQRIVLDWMAYNVQNPGAKIRWAILLQGVEGCGKTFLLNAMRVVLGDDNVRLINSETIKRGWNEWAFGAQVVGVEELRVVGHNRHDVLNALKEPLTNDYVPINERNRGTRTARNVTNYLAFTNFHDALPLDEDSRRWCILKSILQKKEQLLEMRRANPGYFQRLFDMLTTHGPGLRHLLENWIIHKNFSPDGPAPVTTYLHDMVFDTSNDMEMAFKNLIDEGCNPLVRDDVVASGALMTVLKYEFGMEDIRGATIANMLRKAGYGKVQGKRPTIGGVKQYVWARMDRTKDRNPVDILNERATLSDTETDNWA